MEEFHRVRKGKIEIYRNWTISDSGEVGFSFSYALMDYFPNYSFQTSVVVSRNILEDWLSEGLVVPKDRDKALSSRAVVIGTTSDAAASDATLVGSPPSGDGRRSSPELAESSTLTTLPSSSKQLSERCTPVGSRVWDNSDIICDHGKLDPASAAQMKRISQVGKEPTELGKWTA